MIEILLGAYMPGARIAVDGQEILQASSAIDLVSSILDGLRRIQMDPALQDFELTPRSLLGCPTLATGTYWWWWLVPGKNGSIDLTFTTLSDAPGEVYRVTRQCNLNATELRDVTCQSARTLLGLSGPASRWSDRLIDLHGHLQWVERNGR